MKAKNNKNAKQVASSAKQENKVINTNPGYIFRSLNKKAQGRDQDAKQVEGYSRKSLKELFDRLNETFAGGGFWWSSVYAINGRLITSVTPLKQGKYYALNEKAVIRFAGQTYIGTFAKEWSENAVIDSAKVRLTMVEQYGTAIDKAQEQERKAQEKAERKGRKERKESAKELAKVIAELKEQVAAGTITNEQAAAKVAALMAA